MRSRSRLAEWENVKDHAIEQCPDGTYLHAFSINVTNDSARVARYSADWDLIAEGWVEESVPERAHNDMPLICSEHLQAVAFTNHRTMRPTLFEIGPDATVTATHELTIDEHISGSAFKYDAETDQYVMITNAYTGLKAFWLNRDLSLDRIVPFVPVPAWTAISGPKD